MDSKRPTIRDVAAAAGVAGSTVSRYLNGTLDLKLETAGRIDAAVAVTGYQRPAGPANPAVPTADASPTASAVSTAPTGREPQRSSPVLGLIVPEALNQYFSQLVHELSQAAHRAGCELIVSIAFDQPARQETLVDLFSRFDLAGLFYIGTHHANPALARALTDGLPVVVLDDEQAGLTRATQIPATDLVVHDDYAGAFQATSHLLRLGHRRIACVIGPDSLNSQSERLRGYSEALLTAGVDPHTQLIVRGPFTQNFGASALPHILAHAPTPTAVFVTSDIIALGLLDVARSMSVDVPGQLSVVGFDDAPLSRHLQPPLSSVHVSLREMARTALDLMTARLTEPKTPPTRVVVPVTLATRASSAAFAEPITDPKGQP
ncbi:LacI family DNA-binding transcriptional regulator [Brevibacterium moorei]|uniref:LacI family DNA-binding transcriptional regulator n=1 Tax=Brevibacterium moorei TaxID=2968457 RepID=UPI00211BC7E2|nr:LacI family DNA-binding transcriptional regulator [Brevibacterium sp. 68QC2CO]MCQ9386939.1 LacI family DNA-binding transcriptional regulator [Brevibacterium sp. 68QC2CO]